MKKNLMSLAVLFTTVFVISAVSEREALGWGTDILVKANQADESIGSPNMVSTSTQGYFMVTERSFEVSLNAQVDSREQCMVIMRSTDGGQTWQHFFEYCGAHSTPWIAVPEKTQDYVYVVFGEYEATQTYRTFSIPQDAWYEHYKVQAGIGLLKIDLKNPASWTYTRIASLTVQDTLHPYDFRLHNPKIITDNHDVNSYSLYLTYIKETDINDESPFVQKTEVVTEVSTNKGFSWGNVHGFGQNAVTSAAEGPNYYAASAIAYSHGKLYLAYTETLMTNIVKTDNSLSYDTVSRIYVSSSSDFGASWSPPVTVAEVKNTGGWPEPQIAAIQDSSTVMVVYGSEFTQGILYAYSMDGGITWQKNNQIPGTAHTAPFYFPEALTVNPTLGSFQLAFAADWYCQAIYVCMAKSVYYSTAPYANPSAWSLPVKVNQPYDGTDYTYAVLTPTIAIDRASEQPGIAWAGPGGVHFDRKDFSSLSSKPSIVVTDTVVPVDDHAVLFGNINLGLFSEHIINITNVGNAALVIGTIAGANPLASPFFFPGAGECTGQTLAPGGDCLLWVRIDTTVTGSFNDSFDIPSNDPANPVVTVSVSGTIVSAGTVLAPGITVTDSVAPDHDLQIPFGNVTVGMMSDQFVTITNNGNANLTIGATDGANAVLVPFVIPSNKCTGKTIPQSESCTFTVRFIPLGTGTFNATFNITSNDPNKPVTTVSVSGTGIAPPIPTAPVIDVTDSVFPGTDLQIPFGNISDGLTPAQKITITNNGNAALVIGTIAGANPLAAPFGIQSDTCTGKTIEPTGNCCLTIRFAPTGTGTFGDSFDIPSSDPNRPTVTMNVSGTGVSGGTAGVPAIVVTDSVSPDNDLQMPFGNLTEGHVSENTLAITNNGNANLVIMSISAANPLASPFSIQSDNCTGRTLSPAGNCTLTVRFAPTGTGTFEDSFDIPSNDENRPSITLSVSGTGLSSTVNNPPSAPVLVFAANGQTGLGTTVTFRWKKAADPDGDQVSYRLYYSTDQNFAGCTPVTVGDKTAAYAGFGFAGLALLGLVTVRRKGTVASLLLAVALTSGIILSCGGDSGGGGGGGGGTNPQPPASVDEVSVQVSDLNPGTAYFWKVVADDSKGGTTESEVWNFKTQ